MIGVSSAGVLVIVVILDTSFGDVCDSGKEF